MMEKLLFSNILDKVRDNEDETMGRKLVEVVKSTATSQMTKGAAFSGLMNAFKKKRTYFPNNPIHDVDGVLMLLINVKHILKREHFLIVSCNKKTNYNFSFLQKCKVF
ncbi:uncharacterized protein LOC111642277 [Centruroides sculpturatus]|nr:uncharacterized protein LOC111642277 [Centruroides sculpturatus]